LAICHLQLLKTLNKAKNNDLRENCLMLSQAARRYIQLTVEDKIAVGESAVALPFRCVIPPRIISVFQ
jgi:hypothetical protein